MVKGQAYRKVARSEMIKGWCYRGIDPGKVPEAVMAGEAK